MLQVAQYNTDSIVLAHLAGWPRLTRGQASWQVGDGMAGDGFIPPRGDEAVSRLTEWPGVSAQDGRTRGHSYGDVSYGSHGSVFGLALYCQCALKRRNYLQS